jgi:1,4-alpha-glucan branching enzyme
VLGHGRWPHGEDWLAEAIVHCYLPLVGALGRLAARGGRHLLTVSVSPVLAAQLADRRTPSLVEGYLAHRQAAARALVARHPLGSWWEETYEGLAAQWRAVGGDLPGALAGLAAADAIELSTCALTHGYLPLLHRREHVALQVAAARHNHERWFGRPPVGFWMPECAYRPSGPWRHPATGAEEASRPGNEEFLAAAGARWTVVDAHLLLGGEPLVPYPDLWGASEEGVEAPPPMAAQLQPRRIGTSAVAALPREPHTAHQVWSRHGGFPGDPRYLDFHKRQTESGLRLWRVTDAAGDLGEKLPYHPAEARDAVRDQARHFHELLAGIGGLGGGVAVCPYDAELFGHWWFEGVAWLEAVLGRCLEGTPVTPGASITTTTPGRELGEHPPAGRVALHEGSWGEAGDHRVWVSEATAWMWDELRLAEEAVHLALPSLPPARARAALAQLLLLAASDWPFLVTTGTAADYAAERFRLHRERLAELLAGGDDDVLPVWAAEDLAGVDHDPGWWSAREP